MFNTLRVAAASALAFCTCAAGFAGAADRRGPGADAGTTGNNSELVRKVEITPKPSNYRTVMRLDRAKLPSLRPGDDLRVSAEFMITTDCASPQPRCTGKAYEYDPRMDTELVLRVGTRSVLLAHERSVCVQQPGDRQHHCVIPFHGIDASGPARRLDCAQKTCRIELRSRAFNPRAKPGQFVIVGLQDEFGNLIIDKGRINAIRLRGRPSFKGVHSPLERTELPPDLKKRVVISQKLPRLEEGDVIEGWVDLRASVSSVPYHALVTSQIVLAERPDAIHGKRFVDRVASLTGELTEGSGTNCTQAQTPCPVFRTGLLEMREDSVSQRGAPRPLFLNVVSSAGAKLQPARPGDMIRLIDHGGLRARIYPSGGD